MPQKENTRNKKRTGGVDGDGDGSEDIAAFGNSLKIYEASNIYYARFAI